MSDLADAQYAAMHDALLKLAFSGALARRAVSAIAPHAVGAGRYLARSATDAGAGAAMGGAVGGLAGGVGGAIEGYREDGLGGAVGKGTQRARQGATAGAVLGGAGGLAAGGRLGASQFMQSKNPLAMVGRFGERQVHSLTGATRGGVKRLAEDGSVNPRYIEAVKAMKGDSADIANRVLAAKKNVDKAVTQGKGVDAAKRGLERAQAAMKTSDEAIEKGMTSLPGVVNAVRKEGLKPLWTHGIKPQMTQHGVTGAAMTVAPVAMAAPELLQESDEEGRGRAERFLGSVGEAGAYTATPFVPVAGSTVLSGVGRRAGGTVGQGIDKLVGAVSSSRTNKPRLGGAAGSPLTDADADNGAPVERVMSDAAQGKPPEGMML